MKVKLLHSTPLVLIANAIRMSRDNHLNSDSYFINLNIKECSCIKCGNNKNLFLDEDEFICCDNCGIGYRKDVHIGKKDFDLIKRVGFKMKHSSVFEFGYFIFEIDGISRACLQELARHRLSNLTVKSTRYTLKELKDEDMFLIPVNRHYLHLTVEEYIKMMKDKELIILDSYIKDIKKYNKTKERASKYVVFTNNEETNISIIEQLDLLRILIKRNISNDIAKYSLPESFKTKLQWGINLRSLINFLELRTSKEALWEIRKLAITILDELKEKEPLYFELLMENKNIKENY